MRFCIYGVFYDIAALKEVCLSEFVFLYLFFVYTSSPRKYNIFTNHKNGKILRWMESCFFVDLFSFYMVIFEKKAGSRFPFVCLSKVFFILHVCIQKEGFPFFQRNISTQIKI